MNMQEDHQDFTTQSSMTKDLGGAKIYLKREDLNHTGAHKINNVSWSGTSCKEDGKDPSDR